MAQLMELGRVERFLRIRLRESLDGASRRLDGVLGHLHEISIEWHALLGLRGMLDRQRAALGPAQVVGEGEIDVPASCTQPTSEDANAVEQQARVGRLVDRRLDHRRVAAQTLALFDPLLLRVLNEHPVHALEGLGAHPLEVAL
jgi:hypothetical protein